MKKNHTRLNTAKAQERRLRLARKEGGPSEIVLLRPIYNCGFMLYPDGVCLDIHGWDEQMGMVGLSWTADGHELEEQWVWLTTEHWMYEGERIDPQPGILVCRSNSIKVWVRPDVDPKRKAQLKHNAKTPPTAEGFIDNPQFRDCTTDASLKAWKRSVQISDEPALVSVPKRKACRSKQV